MSIHMSMWNWLVVNMIRIMPVLSAQKLATLFNLALRIGFLSPWGLKI